MTCLITRWGRKSNNDCACELQLQIAEVQRSFPGLAMRIWESRRESAFRLPASAFGICIMLGVLTSPAIHTWVPALRRAESPSGGLVVIAARAARASARASPRAAHGRVETLRVSAVRFTPRPLPAGGLVARTDTGTFLSSSIARIFVFFIQDFVAPPIANDRRANALQIMVEALTRARTLRQARHARVSRRSTWCRGYGC